MRRRLKVGIIGCGAIGASIAEACCGRFSRSLELVAVCDLDQTRVYRFKSLLKRNIPLVDINRLVRKVDLVIEAASAKISASVVRKCIDSGKQCMVMSVGGLIGHEALLKEAAAKEIRLYIPSGAVSGIDAVKGAAVGNIRSVTLTTRKPPKGLAGAPYLAKKKIDVMRIRKEKVVFSGSARDAVAAFPANINVSAVLSLAGIGPNKTRVRIVASPGYKRNVHEIKVTGDAGTIVTRTENVPSSDNPKTSQLAINSAIAMLGEIAGSVRLGT